MSNTIITITAVKRSEKNQEIILIKGVDGQTFSGFATNKGQPTPLSTLKVGDVIEADVVIKGQYKNLGAFHIIPTAQKQAPSPQEGQQAVSTVPKVEVSGPEHGCCLNNVVLLYIAGNLKEGDALVLQMWKDLNRGMGTTK